MKKILRTVFTIEILSEERIDHETSADDPTGLDYIKYLLVEGNCFGQVQWKSCQVLDPKEIQRALIRMGDDGTFFGDHATYGDED